MKMKVDVLGPGCAVDAEMADGRVRFTAVRADGQRSTPSGWFDIPEDDEAIALTWSAFDFEDSA